MLGDIHYREPATIQELEALLRLRYTVYAEDPSLNRMVASSTAIDINSFDLRALHFAAFDGQQPVACIRIVMETATAFTPWIETLLQHYMLKLEEVPFSFPFQAYYPCADWSLSFLQRLDGSMFGEVGKLAIHSSYRKEGAILEGLIRAFVDYCKAQQIQTGFGTCTLLLARYYRKFGFTMVEDSVPFTYKDLPEAVLVRFDK